MGLSSKPLGDGAPKTPLKSKILSHNDGILNGILDGIPKKFVIASEAKQSHLLILF